MSETLLSIRDLTVEYGTAEATVVAVQGVSLDLDAGEVLGVVGESGSGKTSIGYAILGHLGGAGRARGQILFCGTDLATLERHAWNGLRGSRIGMVYQEPQSALNPAYTVGEQIAEGLRHHLDLSRRAARDRAVEWLERVHMPEPATIYDRYPHQLSGGQLQRAVIAMTFAPGPELVVMDEPTTGLDVTTQARILDLVAELGKQTGVGILYISHDLSVVADLCDRVIVMHRGKVVEQGSATAVLQRPRQPYTQRLVASIPNLERRQSFAGHNDGTADETGAVQVRFLPPLPSTRRTAATVLELHGVQKIYRSRGQATVACDDVDLDVRAGECVALIGESGSGKSTVAKCILGLERPDGGQIMLDGVALPPSVHQRALDLRRRIQIVFQNPDGSLNGRRTIGDTLKRPLVIHGRGRNRHELEAASAELMESVDLSADFLARYPHELSGGQKQRVAIARALASRPELIICDEPVSALDVSVQSVILDLCRRLQAEQGVAFLFITHDLGVVRQMAERAVVMLKGRVCHVGDVDSLFAKDAHPYVRDLIASVPGRRLAEHRAQPQQA